MKFIGKFKLEIMMIFGFTMANFSCYSYDLYALLHGNNNGNNNDTVTPGTTTNPACNPCKIFITAGTFDGSMVMVSPTIGNATTGATGIAKADNWCNSDSRKPASSSSTYKALLVDSTNRVACTSNNCVTGGNSEHINWVLYANKTYVRLDGTTQIGTTNAYGLLTQTADICSGLPSDCAGPISIWAGLAMSSAPWLSNTNNCTNWSSTLVTVAGGITSSSNLIPGATNGGICSNGYSLICVEQ